MLRLPANKALSISTSASMPNSRAKAVGKVPCSVRSPRQTTRSSRSAARAMARTTRRTHRRSRRSRSTQPSCILERRGRGRIAKAVKAKRVDVIDEIEDRASPSPAAEDECIRAAAAAQSVRALPATQEVPLGAAIQLVSTQAAIKSVASSAAVDAVVPDAARETVRAIPSAGAEIEASDSAADFDRVEIAAPVFSEGGDTVDVPPPTRPARCGLSRPRRVSPTSA